MSIDSNYKNVCERIIAAKKSCSQSAEVELLAVSKKQGFNKIQQLYNLGHRSFGESYVQEAIEKIQQAQASNLEIQWHFIGPIQSNKTKHLAEYFDWVQSVDSLKILNRLNNQRPANYSPLNVLLQIKVTDETTKRGFSVKEMLEVAELSNEFQNLKIRGLMSIPAPTDSYSLQLVQSEKCKQAFDQLKQIISVDTLSLGMSSDLEAAIQAGSNMVRIGTDIFGRRD